MLVLYSICVIGTLVSSHCVCTVQASTALVLLKVKVLHELMQPVAQLLPAPCSLWGA